jgi:HK97 family phage major capsid protein
MGIKEARAAYNEAVARMNTAADAIDAADGDADLDALQASFESAKADVERSKRSMDSIGAIVEARNAFPVIADPSVTATPGTESRAAASVSVGREESVYRPDVARSFYSDMIHARRGDQAASERLYKHQAQMRDVTTTITSSGGGFIPPQYLGDLYAEMARAGRPFADVLPKLNLPLTGMTISIPKITTGVTTAVQATENTGVSETDHVSTQISVPVVTIAGLNDVSKQLFDRSDPGIDQIIFMDLLGAYNAALDTQLISGTGANGQHDGLDNVTSINTVTFTEGSPTAANTIPRIYDAIQKVHSNRYAPPTHILMHPRRAAALASGLSSTFPVFQQGGLTQAVGTQSVGIIGTMCGLPVVVDANITTTEGASTNQDAIYVVRAPDMPLMEGPIQTDVFADVGSAGLTVRLRLFSYSAFASNRQPKGITKISGTGLVAPTFA